MKVITVNETEYNLRIEGEYSEETGEIRVVVKEINDEELMEFPEALEAVLDGAKITRLGWEFIDGHVYFDIETVSLRFHNNRVFDGSQNALYMAPSCDLLATDWVVIDSD